MSTNPLMDRLFNVLGAPAKTENVAGFLAEYRRLTDHFSAAVLEKAADYLVGNAGAHWPTPKACVEACVDAQDMIAGQRAAHPSGVKMPWERHAELAKTWATDFCREAPLAKQAFDEGWGRALFLYVQSFAHNAYRHNQVPQRKDFSLKDKDIAYYRRFASTPLNMDWIDRVVLIGPDPKAPAAERIKALYETIEETRSKGPKYARPIPKGQKAQRAGDIAKSLFRSPLPPAVSEEQFQIDKETGAA